MKNVSMTSLISLLLWASVSSAQWWNPFAGRQAEEQDRSSMKVNCDRLDEVLTEKEMIVDGVKMVRKVVKDEKYVRCLKQPKAPWKVAQAEWTPENNKKWEDFIAGLGASNCRSVDTCMVSAKANPYRSEEDMEAYHYSDCADFPLYLRAYFAYKNNLPFGYLSGLNERPAENPEPEYNEDGTPKTKDFRYSPNGNLPAARRSIFSRGAGRCFSRDFYEWSTCMVDVYHTGMARMSKWEPGREQPVAPDYYSPRVNRESIRPGTVVYNSSGHIALVYKVGEDGQVYIISAHPGGGVDRGLMDSTYIMDGPKSGSGFKNWRPFKVNVTKRERDGSIADGTLVFAKDEEISDFSMEQYYGHGDQNDLFSTGKYDGKKVYYNVDGYQYKKSEFYRFKQVRLLAPGVKINPAREVERALNQMCEAFTDRVLAVNKAVEDRISIKPEPAIYPESIYGSSGEWENYSSPGRDARLRQMVIFLKRDFQYYVKLAKETRLRPLSFFEYQGTSLKEDIERGYHRANYACRIRYRNGDGRMIDLTLSDVLSRLALLSFDPYHCIERRWGARNRTESKSCVDDANKTAWYQSTQFLRNIVSRPEGLKTNKSLEEFQSWVNGLTVVKIGTSELSTQDTSSEYDVLKAIQAL